MYTYEKLKAHHSYQYMLDCINDNLKVKVNGEIITFPTPRYVKLQMKSLLNDLERQNDDDFEFFFDEAMMLKIIKLTKIINLSDGLLRGKSCYEALAPFQWVALIMLFCWKFKDNPKKRRYESCLISLGRKNGKTALIGIIMIILLLIEEKYSKFYSLAPNRELSNIIKTQMYQIIECSPALSKHFKNIKTELRLDINSSTFQPLSYNENRLDSRQITAFVVDEIGEFSSDSLAIESLESGCQNVINKLSCLISTAYPTQDNLFEKYVEYSEKVLSGLVNNKRHFSLLYRPNEEFLDDYLNEICIFQSNPLSTYLSTIDIDDNMKFLYKKREDAVNIPSTATNYKNKLLNIPTNGVPGETFCQLDTLQECRLDNYNWNNKEVHLGLDLSFSNDNCGLAMMTYDNDMKKYICQTFTFIPEDSIERKSKTEKIDYKRYIDEHKCFAVGDRIIDYSFIEEFIINGLKEKFKVKIMSVNFDKYNANALINHIENETDIQCVEIPQSFMVMHPAIKRLQECILTNKFAYVDNGLMELNFTNAVCVWNPSMSLMRVSKKASRFKIDALMSVINIMVTIDQFEEKKESVYEKGGIDYFNNFFNDDF